MQVWKPVSISSARKPCLIWSNCLAKSVLKAWHRCISKFAFSPFIPKWEQAPNCIYLLDSISNVQMLFGRQMEITERHRCGCILSPITQSLARPRVCLITTNTGLLPGNQPTVVLHQFSFTRQKSLIQRSTLFKCQCPSPELALPCITRSHCSTKLTCRLRRWGGGDYGRTGLNDGQTCTHGH